MKNNKKSPQFPNIYRIITENKFFKEITNLEISLLNQSKHKKTITYFLSFTTTILIIVLLIGSLTLTIKLYQGVGSYLKIANNRQDLSNKINFWQSFTQKYDGYKDAYFQIALLQYQLGNFEKAKESNKKALLLDPGFKDAKSLEILLENK